MAQHERVSRTEVRSGSTAGGKVLLIDDDESFSRVVARFLRKHAFAVTSVPSGQEGVRAASELEPDLIICDLAMPGMDGYEVLARLRQDSKTADVPVIFLTGQSAPEQIREGMNLGADDYLTKPVDADNLLRAVNARLTRARAGRLQREKEMERAVQTFAGVVHDLRDPLFVVFGYTDRLKQGAAKSSTTDQASEEILDRMQQAIGRMQTIVSETMFLAKSKMQRLPFDPGLFDLRTLCERVIADQDHGDRLRFACREKALPLIGDALRLQQALENLLANSLKYSDGEVCVTLTRRASSLQVEVKDQGIGIPESEQARVFDPFFRGSNTGGKPGHGLGLSIVKTCVEQHRGNITLASQVGKGTTVTLDLPDSPLPEHRSGGSAVGSPHPQAWRTPVAAVSSQLTTPGGPGSKPPIRSDRMRGIIVDDDPLVRDVLRDLLTRTGEIEVVGEAGSIAQARELAAQCRPNVVFLDINLPDGKGFELLPHLEAGTSVVFVTGAEDYALNAFDADAVDYLLKPVSADRLRKALQRVRQRSAPPAPSPPATIQLGLDDVFLVKTMSEKKFVKVRDVKSLIAYGEYSWVYWSKCQGALMRKTLKQWETELPEDQFVRIHRNAIINLAFMVRAERLASGRLQVHLRDTNDPLAVSLRLAPALNRKLKSFKA